MSFCLWLFRYDYQIGCVISSIAYIWFFIRSLIENLKWKTTDQSLTLVCIKCFFFFFLLTGCCTSLIPEQFSTDHPDSYTVTVQISLSLLLYSKFRLKIATVKNCFSALLRSFSCSDSNIEIISQIFRSSLQFNARNPNRTNMYIRVETSKYICRITLGEWKWNQANLRQLDLVHYARYYIIYMLFCLEYLPFVSVPCRFQFLSIVHRVRDR